MRVSDSTNSCFGVGRSDVLKRRVGGAGRSSSSSSSVFSSSKNTKKTKNSTTSPLDRFLSILASVILAAGTTFGVTKAAANTDTTDATDYSSVKMSNTCLDEDDVEILNALNSENSIENISMTTSSNNTQYTDVQSLTDAIYESDDDAAVHMQKLSSALNMSENEVSAYLINLTQSEQYGNGCIDPLTFYAQICQESGCDNTARGDKSSKTGEYLALGFGQFHTCAVDEVNNQIAAGTYGDYTYNNGEEYTYEDREDPKKSLEMMVLLLRYDASKTEDENGMLAMYNQGNKNGINTTDGKNYVAAVLGQIGKSYSLS